MRISDWSSDVFSSDLAFLSWACSWCARDLHGHSVQAAILRDQCTAIDADHFAVWEARTQATERDRIVDRVAIGRHQHRAVADQEIRIAARQAVAPGKWIAVEARVRQRQCDPLVRFDIRSSEERRDGYRGGTS